MTSFVAGLLKSVAGAVSSLPFTLGEPIPVPKHSLHPNIWTLYHGTRREDGSAVTVFVHDRSVHGSAYYQLAQNAVKRLKTLRHPGILKYIESLDMDPYVYLVTEPVTPLDGHVDELRQRNRESLSWGLASIGSTVAFLNDQGHVVHGNVCVASVFVSRSGEWRLGGFELTGALAGFSVCRLMTNFFDFLKLLLNRRWRQSGTVVQREWRHLKPEQGPDGRPLKGSCVLILFFDIIRLLVDLYMQWIAGCLRHWFMKFGWARVRGQNNCYN
jgi:hypothetical protein